MRYDEAIKFCEGYLPQCDLKKIVIEALEKQIPKKPNLNHHCPICGRGLPSPKITDQWCEDCYYWNFCPDCGQAIDWSDKND